jgi:hypothetical protein
MAQLEQRTSMQQMMLKFTEPVDQSHCNAHTPICTYGDGFGESQFYRYLDEIEQEWMT